MECSTQAFAHMHERNWLHKDIKPDNILLTKGGEVRVIDFSLAGRPSSAVGRMVTRKKSIAIQGTRTYIAPEQIRREKITKASDIYSLGILLYEAFTGRPPFMGSNPNELLMAHVRDKPDVPSSYHPNVSSEADALVMRMLSKKPADRPESMQAIFSEVRSMKLFKQDPETYQKERLAKEADEALHTIDQRLDSRKDAARTEVHGYIPMEKKPPKARPAETKTQPAAKSSPAPAAQQSPMQQPPMQQPMVPQSPMYHPSMMPPQQMPGGYPPGAYPPGAFPPGAYPPGGYPQGAYPPPQMQPGMPPGGPPPSQPFPGAPQQPPAQQQPAQQKPAAAAPQPASKPPAAPPSPQPPASDADKKEPETPDNLDWLSVS